MRENRDVFEKGEILKQKKTSGGGRRKKQETDSVCVCVLGGC